MAVDKRELIVDMLARDNTKQATDSFAKNMDTAAASADDAAKSTENLSKTTAVAGEDLDDFGKAARDNADNVKKLSRDIGLVENELKSLHAAFARAEDDAERLDLSKGIRRMEADLKRLNKSKGFLSALLPDPAEAAAAASEVGTTVGTEIGASATKAVGPAVKPMIPVLAGVAIAAAPIIGATISAAIIGGAGIGGVVGGVMLAARDQQVAKAADDLGQILLGDLGSRAKFFVEPVLKAIDDIKSGFAGMGGDLDRIFVNSAKFVDPLTQGVLGAVQRITDGIADLTEAAGPVIDVISTGVAELGDAIGDVFTDLSDNGVDAAVALNTVFQALEGTIRVVGGTVNALTESFGFLAKIGAFGREAQLEYIRLEANAKLAADANTAVAESLGTVKGAGAEAGSVLKELIYGLDTGARSAYGQRDALISLNKTMRAQADPVFGLLDAQSRLKEAQDATAEATKKHGRNSDEAKEALRRQADAILEVQGRAGELGNAFNGKLSPALRQTLIDGGLTTGQIDALEQQFREAKAAGDKFDGKYTADVAVNGAAAASKKVRSITDDLRAFDGVWTATMITNYERHGKPGTGGGLSHGGIVEGPGTSTSDSIPKMLSKGEYVVRASEVAKPGVRQMLESLNSGKGYAPPGAARFIPGGWSGGGAGGGVQTVRVVLDVTGAEGKFKTWFREMVRTGGL